ncbi:hypothetical protein SDC9_119366 [bioreactor metagenome]|uniref:Uncharacterized protein n=1 Tax=bioreactor metagenome TaxID=1076179 RepID=A0A645C5X6_9ZZZZ
MVYLQVGKQYLSFIGLVKRQARINDDEVVRTAEHDLFPVVHYGTGGRQDGVLAKDGGVDFFDDARTGHVAENAPADGEPQVVFGIEREVFDGAFRQYVGREDGVCPGGAFVYLQ